ncbi:MAG TPA: PAS domain-containing protein [Chloroflexota bacterium]|nr:PAS domain-containing protein [Chloroflexota bacterium]
MATTPDHGAPAARYGALPAGVLVHDAAGALRYASPAATELLGLAREPLGALATDALCARLALVDAAGAPLQPTALPWEEARQTGTVVQRVLGVRAGPRRRWLAAHAGPLPDATPLAILTLLVDITEAQQHAALAHEVLDALPMQIAVLDGAGRIVGVSGGWRRFALSFARDNALVDPTGTDYLAVCGGAAGPDAELAQTAAQGIRAVLTGQTRSFAAEYPCRLPTGLHWFFMYVVPRPDTPGAVVAHVDITSSHRAQVLEAEARLREARRHERAREHRGLESLASTLARESAPLAERDPHVFAALVARYGELLDLAVEQRRFQVQHELSAALRELAERVATAGGPRDALALHLAALAPRLAAPDAEAAQLYAEEGRLALVELLAQLAAYLHAYSAVAGQPRVPPAVAPSPPALPAAGGSD